METAELKSITELRELTAQHVKAMKALVQDYRALSHKHSRDYLDDVIKLTQTGFTAFTDILDSLEK